MDRILHSCQSKGNGKYFNRYSCIRVFDCRLYVRELINYGDKCRTRIDLHQDGLGGNVDYRDYKSSRDYDSTRKFNSCTHCWLSLCVCFGKSG